MTTTAVGAAVSGSGAAAAGPRQLRICVVGDELVAGTGDPRSLGWVGRVGARTERGVASSTMFPLGVPGETTADLLARWHVETARRFEGSQPGERHLVVGLGRHDVYELVSLPRSRLNLANMLDEATARGLPTFVVGPPPGPDERLNARIGELSGAFADVCVRRHVPYVDTFTPLVAHEDWLTDLAGGDGRHPGQAGYGLIAWLVLHGGWHTFLGLRDADTE